MLRCSEGTNRNTLPMYWESSQRSKTEMLDSRDRGADRSKTVRQPEKQRILPWQMRSDEKLLDMGIVLEDTQRGCKMEESITKDLPEIHEKAVWRLRSVDMRTLLAAGPGLYRRRQSMIW